MKSSKYIVYKNYDSVKEFINAISPISTPWFKGNWIFRGQRDVNWKLIPSAFRKGAWQPYKNLFLSKIIEKNKNKKRLIDELYIIAYFARLADKHGLSTPGFDYTWLSDDMFKFKYRQHIETTIKENDFFPLPEYRALFGMAQHYGIPTRLLDWSESPFIAAYFAASDALKYLEKNSKEGASKYLAIWALDVLPIKFFLFDQIIIVRAPWESNPNLRAQKGLFTIHGKILNPDKPEIIEALEDKLQNIFKNNSFKKRNGFYHKEIVLYRLGLPIKDAPLLLSALSRYDINAASLFPGYKGITQFVQEISRTESFKGSYL